MCSGSVLCEVLSLRYEYGLAFSDRPRGPARIRVAPPAHGAAAGGRAPGSQPAPLRFAPGPGPGPGRALRSATRLVAAPGPSPLYEPAAGPSRARTAPSRDPSFARRARPPGGPLRRRRRTGSTIASSARPLPDRGRSTSRQPGPSGPGLRCHVTHALRGARGPRRVRITDTESYRDLQESYGAYNFVTELEIRTVRVLSRPYNQGTYGRCAGMARRLLTV